MIFAVEGHRSRTLQAEARKQFGHAEVHMRNETARGQDVPLVEVLPHRAFAEVLEAIVRKAIERRRLHQVHRRLRNQHLTPRRSQNAWVLERGVRCFSLSASCNGQRGP